MRKRVILGLLVGALMATMLPGVTVALGAREPSVLEWEGQIRTNYQKCDNGRLGFQLRSFVMQVPNSTKSYYQIGEIKFQKKIGTNRWSRIDSVKQDRLRFGFDDLPTYSTFGDATLVGQTNVETEIFRVTYTIWLKRVRFGPDPTVWKVTGVSGLKKINCGGGNVNYSSLGAPIGSDLSDRSDSSPIRSTE